MRKFLEYLLGAVFFIFWIAMWLGFLGIIPYGSDTDDDYGRETPAFYPLR